MRLLGLKSHQTTSTEESYVIPPGIAALFLHLIILQNSRSLAFKPEVLKELQPVKYPQRPLQVVTGMPATQVRCDSRSSAATY